MLFQRLDLALSPAVLPDGDPRKTFCGGFGLVPCPVSILSGR
jgi:hypothetical protein